MNPSDPHASLAALRQLKELLDAGTITAQEFETLKRQLIFGTEPTAAPTADAPTSTTEVPAAPTSVAPELPGPEPEETWAAYQTNAPNPPDAAAATPDWLAAAAPSLLPAEEAAPAGPEERRNPLNLVFAIGGLLVFLGAVVYLLLGRPATPDEHLTSGTQTAADSTAAVPEVGPQTEQITLPAAAPETVRVATPVARPVPAPAASQFQADSAAAPAATTPAKKAVPATAPAAPPAPTDSAASKPQ